MDRATFDRRYAAGTLKTALIGMSNIGKSYSGMRLATHYDFSLIEIDKLIWQELGQGSMDDFAKWQGQPYSDGYEVRETKSIALENVATAKALKTEARNPLLDTTGSVIYASDDVLNALKDEFFVVYIQASETAMERLKTLYFETPKPLIWAGHYKALKGKTETLSILASYPDLMASRGKAYAALSDRTISSDDILNTELTHAQLLDLIKPAV